MSGVALVTGASRGVGRATARALAEAGFRTILAARDAERLAATVAECGPGARAETADVADPDAVDTLFAGIEAREGRLDIVFNNAGVFLPAAAVGDVTFEDWRRVLSVNLDGAFLVARAAFRMMRDQDPRGGRIINNGSISAHVPRPGSVAYTASKHAITGLTRAIALDGRAIGIACGQIDIGNAASDMTARMPEGVPQPDGRIAAEPVIDAQHVARAVVEMARLPLDVSVPFMTVMATGMPYIGRG
ncbi:MAG: SDR family oxidoreductase [Paracoccaceae bacterium]